jgi:hypothetical protein
MRLSATILLVACCSASLVGCCNRFHRHSCLFGDRHKHNQCVDQEEWDECDGGHSDCPCDGGQMMPSYMPPMDSGCGCGCESSMPAYFDGGMPMSYPSFPQSGGCSSCGGNGGMMMGTPIPTYSNQSMMMQPMPEATPTLAPTAPPSAPPASAPPASSVPPTTEYYSPRTIAPTSSVPAAF